MSLGTEVECNQNQTVTVTVLKGYTLGHIQRAAICTRIHAYRQCFQLASCAFLWNAVEYAYNLHRHPALWLCKNANGLKKQSQEYLLFIVSVKSISVKKKTDQEKNKSGAVSFSV